MSRTKRLPRTSLLVLSLTLSGIGISLSEPAMAQSLHCEHYTSQKTAA